MKPYFQTSPYTTAAAALLTILHHVDPNIPLEKEKEFDIWKKTVNLPTRASSIFALAHYAKKHGCQSKVIVERKEYDFPDYRFYRYTKEDIEHASFVSQSHLKEAETDQTKVEERSFDLEEIKRRLSEKSLILLRLNVKPIRNTKRNTSNFVVVHGYSNGYFHIIDSGYSALSTPEKTMQEAFESLETKKYRTHQMIVFSTVEEEQK